MLTVISHRSDAKKRRIGAGWQSTQSLPTYNNDLARQPDMKLAQHQKSLHRAFHRSYQPITRPSVRRSAMISAEYTAYVKGDPASNKLGDVSVARKHSSSR